MMEAIVALIISLITFAIGYGILIQKVNSNKQISDERYNLVIKDIDSLQETNDETSKVLTDIKVTLQRLSSDIHYIKEKMEDK